MTRLLWCLLFLTACNHVRINETTGDTQHQVRLNPNWVTDKTIDGPCKDVGTGLESVRVSSNYGYALLSVFTLGLVSLVDIEYSCAPQTGVERAPVPTPD